MGYPLIITDSYFSERKLRRNEKKWLSNLRKQTKPSQPRWKWKFLLWRYGHTT